MVYPPPPISEKKHNKHATDRLRIQMGGGGDKRCSKELLGHIGPTTLVDDVGDDEKNLERNNQEDKEAHTRS